MKKAVNNKRPVNLGLRTIKLPVAAYTSVLHRISGVILFLNVAVLLFTLGKLPSSEKGFGRVRACPAGPLAKLVIRGLLPTLLYHLVASVRYLVMDISVGEVLEGGKRGSKIVIAITVMLIVLAGVWAQ